MATVKSNKSITIMKYNVMDVIEISIRDLEDNEIPFLSHRDTMFLYYTLKKWIDELGKIEINKF